MTQPGQPAPEFTLPRNGGGTVTLSDLQGRAVVLYFYPRDDTPGCTLEAQDFTAQGGKFAATGATVLGISKDTVAKHDKFRAKYALDVTLLSDANSDVCERYGVWVEKNMYGKKSMGIDRTTVLIGADGTIAQVWHKVKVQGHVAQVLEAVQTL